MAESERDEDEGESELSFIIANEYFDFIDILLLLVPITTSSLSSAGCCCCFLIVTICSPVLFLFIVLFPDGISSPTVTVLCASFGCSVLVSFLLGHDCNDDKDKLAPVDASGFRPRLLTVTVSSDVGFNTADEFLLAPIFLPTLDGFIPEEDRGVAGDAAEEEEAAAEAIDADGSLDAVKLLIAASHGFDSAVVVAAAAAAAAAAAD